MEAEKTPFETWAIVEILGHKQIAGKVTEQAIAGQNMLRVDVPELGPERPAHTKYFGGSSIYAIHPCSEELATSAARKLAQVWGSTPLPVHIPELGQAMDVVRQAEALRAEQKQLAATAGNGVRNIFDADEDVDEHDEFDLLPQRL